MSAKKRGRPELPDNIRKKEILIKLPPGLIDFMDSQGARMRPTLIEQAMIEKFSLCPACFKPLHKFHNCELNPTP